MLYKKHRLHISLKRSLSLVLALWFLTFCGVTLAQNNVQSECQQAGRLEVLQQNSQPLSWPFFEQKQVLDLQCWINLENIQSEDKKFTLVDVRSINEIQLHPLQETRELPLHALESDLGLQGRSLVLVGTGFDQVRLDQACIQLRQKGVDVVALRGGARTLGGSALGQYSSIDYTQITPQEFALGSATIPWKLVSFGLDEEMLSHLPQKPVLDGHKETQALFEGQAIQEITYVLIAPDEISTIALQRNMGKAGITNTVWLQGGLDAYENYIRQQHMIRTSAGRPLLRPCGSL